MRVCSVNGCQGAYRSKGMCDKHGTRMRKHGHTDDPKRTLPFKDRLRVFVEVLESGCIEWTGYRTEQGYGQLWNGKRRIMAHRASWEEKNGKIPEGMHVCHKCDNPPCINPEHLFLGTDFDNMRDKIEKGRQAKGSQLGKLSEDDVVSIKRKIGKVLQKDIAKEFGVSAATIYYIEKGKTWKHVRL